MVLLGPRLKIMWQVGRQTRNASYDFLLILKQKEEEKWSTEYPWCSWWEFTNVAS